MLMLLRQQAVPAVLCYYYMCAQVSSPRVFISPPSCSACDLLLLKLLEFLRCDVPVSSTLGTLRYGDYGLRTTVGRAFFFG